MEKIGDLNEIELVRCYFNFDSYFQYCDENMLYFDLQPEPKEASAQETDGKNVVQEEAPAQVLENAISCLNLDGAEQEHFPSASNLPMEQTTEVSNGMDLLTSTLTSLTEVAPVVILLEKKSRNAPPDTDELESSDSGARVIPPHLSLKLPRGYHAMVGLREEGQTMFVGENLIPNEGGTKTITTFSSPVKFELPDDIYRFIVQLDEKELASSSSSILPLPKRLEGWKIKQVARYSTTGNRFDKTFHHEKTGNLFRSFVMVETYIVYGGRTKHISNKKKQPEKPTVSGESCV